MRGRNVRYSAVPSGGGAGELLREVARGLRLSANGRVGVDGARAYRVLRMLVCA